MSMAETVRVLRAMSLFQGLHDKALRVVALSGEALVLNAGERLWEKDDDGPFVVIVLAGEADVLVPTPRGEVSVATLGEGEIIGEMAVLTGRPRSTAVAARTGLRVLRVDGEVMLDLMHEFPALALEIGRVLAHRLDAMNARTI
ncbi:MAG: cyclic nucleotide-binding domain-containing protein [Pseudomonadota bacterium]